MSTRTTLQKFPIANIITLIRMFIISPLLFYAILTNKVTIIILFFSLGILTDFIDGPVARWLKQITKFGETADPVADKILIIGVIILIYLTHQNKLLLTYFTPTFITEFVLFFGALILLFTKFKNKVRANKYGKTKFGLQCIGGLMFIVNIYLMDFPMIINYSMLWLSSILAVLSIYKHIESLKN